MRIFLPELAILNLREKISRDEPEYLTVEDAWQILRAEVTRGHAPEDFGDDIARWEAWVDHEYTRLHRVASGTASYKLLGPASATGKHFNSIGESAMVRVVLGAAPVEGVSPIEIDDSACRFVRHQLVADERRRCLTAISDGIRDCAARHRLVGARVSILEMDFHPTNLAPESFSIAAARAFSEAVRTAGTIPV